MSQHDFTTINPITYDGGDLSADLNSWVPAVVSSHSGAARPSYAAAGTVWYDTAGTLKFFNGATDDVIMKGAITAFGTSLAESADASDARTKLSVNSKTEFANYSPASDYFDGGGAADVYTLSAISPRLAPTTLVDGMRFRAIFDDNNTGACTVNPFGLGAVNIKLEGGVTDPSAGQIVADEETTLIYRTSPSAHAELVLSSDVGLGVNQTWQDLTASRAVDTTYTNTTGRPIKISVISTQTSNNNVGASLDIDGDTVQWNQGYTTSGTIPYASVSEIIPNGSSYSVSIQVGDSLYSWMELR
jgi:hypothetical protein